MREKLRVLFEVVHLRRQLRHITMRDLRSALSWVVFRDHSCEDVAALVSGNPQPAQILSLLYTNAYASDGVPPEGQSDDRLVARLRQIDPAETANPAADRELHFRGAAGLPMLAFEMRSLADREPLEAWRRTLRDGWDALQSPDALTDRRAYHSVLRRIAYFERRDDCWETMFPYRHLRTFRDAIAGQQNLELSRRLLSVVCQQWKERGTMTWRSAMSVCAPVRNPRPRSSHSASSPQPTSARKSRWTKTAGSRYVEYTPDRLLLYHDPQDQSHRESRRGAGQLQVSWDAWNCGRDP